MRNYGKLGMISFVVLFSFGLADGNAGFRCRNQSGFEKCAAKCVSDDVCSCISEKKQQGIKDPTGTCTDAGYKSCVSTCLSRCF